MKIVHIYQSDLEGTIELDPDLDANDPTVTVPFVIDTLQTAAHQRVLIVATVTGVGVTMSLVLR